MAVDLESEDAPTTGRTSTRSRRIQVITGGERRRRWTAEQKREIAAESLQPGISPVVVARRYGISSGLLYTWQQQLLCGALGVMADTKPRFVRVDGFRRKFRAGETWCMLAGGRLRGTGRWQSSSKAAILNGMLSCGVSVGTWRFRSVTASSKK
jgi:transposase-like protein